MICSQLSTNRQLYWQGTVGSTRTGSQGLLNEHCNSVLRHGVKLCCVFPHGNFSGIFFYQLVNKTSPSCFQISHKCHSSHKRSTSSPLSLARPGLAFTRNAAEELPSSSTRQWHLKDCGDLSERLPCKVWKCQPPLLCSWTQSPCLSLTSWQDCGDLHPDGCTHGAII